MNLQSQFGPREFRDVTGLFATGVAVVAVRNGGRTHGMTVNSFTSVSLNPPLVLVCVDREAQLLPAINESGEFYVSFLTAAQEAHSRKFARQEGGESVQEPIFWEEGGAFIRGAAGGLQCSLFERYDAGDHLIVLGRVHSVWRSEVDEKALLFYRGHYLQSPR